MSAITFELDHIFICVDPGAIGADRLVSFGLLEGSSNVHPGQGTMNRRFFFHNAMLELLWVHDPAEAQSEPIQRTQLWDRWRDRNPSNSPLKVCPFGLCLRPTESSDRSEQTIAAEIAAKYAFAHWDYHPPYLPETLSIAVGNNSDRLNEPMLFQTPFSKRPDQQPIEKRQPLNHPIGLREITRVELVGPWIFPLSSEMQSVLDQSPVSLRSGEAFYLELGFDGELQGKCMDLRSEFPLLIYW